MSHKYAHLREKAIKLRTEQHMTLDDIIERLALPKTTVWYWIKDLPIPRTEKQSEAQRRKAQLVKEKYAKLRDAAYQRGWEEAPELLKDVTFRDFVVLYMGEGTKRNRNQVAFVNSNASMVKLAHRWMLTFSRTKLAYYLQYHVDQDLDELKQYWGKVLDIQPETIKDQRKSNSGKLSGRQFRSVYGILSIQTGDTYFRSRLQAWMDYIKAQW